MYPSVNCTIISPDNGLSPVWHQAIIWTNGGLLPPLLQRSWKEGILVSPCPSVRPSICGQNLVRSVSSTILIGSISCLQYYQATSEGVSCVMFVFKLKNLKFWRILEICNFDFVFFWLGIQYDSIVWVIMRQQGYPKNTGILVLIGPLEQISRKFTSPLPPKNSS